MAQHTGTIERYSFETGEFVHVETVEFNESMGAIHEAWRMYQRQGEGFYRARWDGYTLFGLDHPEDSGH
jgi:hypothetical protein